jgi:hypothetical protein
MGARSNRARRRATVATHHQALLARPPYPRHFALVFLLELRKATRLRISRPGHALAAPKRTQAALYTSLRALCSALVFSPRAPHANAIACKSSRPLHGFAAQRPGCLTHIAKPGLLRSGLLDNDLCDVAELVDQGGESG